MVRAIYPGSFDPTTLGHMDIIERAAKLVDFLSIAVLKNTQKKYLFTVEERVEHLSYLTKHIANVGVYHFDGLTINCAKDKGAKLIIRGVRALTDFDYEFQIAHVNKTLDGDIETIFIPTNTSYSYLSSSIVKEVFSHSGNVDAMVSPYIKTQLTLKYNSKGLSKN